MKLAVRSTGAHPWRRAHNMLAIAATVFATTALPAQVVFHVSLGQDSATSVSGRLLVFAKPLGPADKRPVAAVNMDQIDTHATAIAAQEVPRPRARRHGRDRRGRHGLPHTFLAAQARPLRRSGGARSRPQLQLHWTRPWRSRERSRGDGPARQRSPAPDA